GGAPFSTCAASFCKSSPPRGPQQCGARRWKTTSPVNVGLLTSKILVQPLDRVIQVVGIHVADVEMKLVRDLWTERRPVVSEDLKQIVFLPLLGHRFVEGPGRLVP